MSTGVNAQNKNTGILYFEVPDTQDTIYYICASHGGMNGTLFVTEKAPVAFSAKLGSDQGSISASTSTVLIFDTEDFDSNGAYDTSNGRFTVPSGEGGKYCLNAVFRTNSSGTMVRCNISLRKNGSATIAQFNNNQRSSGEASSAVSWCGTLAAGDYVDVRIFQDSSTGTVAAVAGDGKTLYSGHKILGV